MEGPVEDPYTRAPYSVVLKQRTTFLKDREYISLKSQDAQQVTYVT